MSCISLTTDFGVDDWFVGTMKGVIHGKSPTANIIDLTHGIPHGDIRAGRRLDQRDRLKRTSAPHGHAVDGDELIAIVFAGSEKARLAQDLTGEVRVLVIDPPGASDGPGMITDQLGEIVTGYWRGLAVPPDPFGPAPFRFGSAAAPSF